MWWMGQKTIANADPRSHDSIVSVLASFHCKTSPTHGASTFGEVLTATPPW